MKLILSALCSCLGLALSVQALAARSYEGKGPAGCTDKKCWQQAVDTAVAACKAAPCTSCTTPANASDNCKFDKGYTCNSICQDKPAPTYEGKGPAGCTDKKCWQQAVDAAVAACKAAPCTSCTTPANASDNCKFDKGYTCNSICQDKK